ncbi:hypothetical protein [Longimicrobium sp.]|uniref:hypothetical protein n=1 Tax=Longimicrobium sp. TaxID=2029185 RepID=UPI003B3B6F3D
MPSINIQQFRDRLAGRAEYDSITHAYREIACRPELAHGVVLGEWVPWMAVAASRPTA